MSLETALDSIRGELAAQLGEHRAEVNGELALLRQEMAAGRDQHARESQDVRNELSRIGRTLGQLVTDDLRGEIAGQVKAGIRGTIWKAAGALATAIGVATGVIALFT